MGLHLGLTLSGRPAAFTFTPTDLSTIVAWYDPSDLSTMYQDAAGTTPVTGANQPVGRINDKTFSGYDLTQSTALSRPMLRFVGGLWYLEFDGVDDYLENTSTRLGYAANPDISFMISLSNTTPADALTRTLFIIGTGSNKLTTGITNKDFGWYYTGGNVVFDTNLTDGTDYVIRTEREAGADFETVLLAIDGSNFTTVLSTSNPTGVPTDTTNGFSFGVNASGNYLEANVYEMVFAGALSAEDRTNIDTYLEPTPETTGPLTIEAVTFTSGSPDTLELDVTYTGASTLTCYAATATDPVTVTAAQLKAGSGGTNTIEFFNFGVTPPNDTDSITGLTSASNSADRIVLYIEDGDGISSAIAEVAVSGLSF